MQIDSIEVIISLLVVGILALAAIAIRLRSTIEYQRDWIKILKDVAYLDDLTGLLRRDAFESELNRQISSLPTDGDKRHSQPLDALSVLFIDLDNFSLVNNSYGHLFGDEVLRQLSHAVLNNLRDTDLAGRWGGDEFVVVLPGVCGQESEEVAQKFRQTIADVTTLSESGTVVRVTASIGVTCIAKQESLKDLIGMADQAAYEAKHQGRNRVVVHTPKKPELPKMTLVHSRESDGES